MPDVPENYSSLREAVDRILGLPPGGTAGTQQGQGGGFESAPRPSYSSDLSNIATETAVSNTPFDPFAGQNAQLAALKAQTDALNAQAAAPAATPAVEAASNVMDSNAAYVNNLLRAGRTDEAATAANMIKAQGGSIGTAIIPATGTANNLNTVAAPNTSFGRPVAPAAQFVSLAKSSTGAPLNPGTKVPWQVSQQYWKDLEAYQKAGGK